MQKPESAQERRTRIAAMRIGGEKLGRIRDELAAFAQPGVIFTQIEEKAQELIHAAGAVPSFSTVSGYRWATCLMKNDALCHGIPNETVVNSGDIVTIDVGLIWEGFHLDTTTTTPVGDVPADILAFLDTGRRSLARSIEQVRDCASVYSVSSAMEKVLVADGCSPVELLTGHGIGRRLHMEPNIPCRGFRQDKRIQLIAGQTICVESMYARGSAALTLDSDGWTYRTKDGSLSAMFEDTVLVTEKGFEVLTKPSVSGIL